MRRYPSSHSPAPEQINMSSVTRGSGKGRTGKGGLSRPPSRASASSSTQTAVDQQPLLRSSGSDDDGDGFGADDASTLAPGDPDHDGHPHAYKQNAAAGGARAGVSRGGCIVNEADAAASLLRKMDLPPGTRIKVTAEDDARVLGRIDRVVLPLMLAVYFLQGLDKATIALASVFGLIEDTGLRGDEYSWLGSVVYVAQLIMQFPLAWILVKLPIGKFTSCMVALWGLTLTSMAAAHSFRSLLVARWFLGAFEASIAPSFISLTAMFYKRREQPLRMSYWYAMNGFTNLFGSLFTWGLAQIPLLSLKPYQVIFIVFGLFTVAFSFVMFSYMPDSPIEAKFFTDHEKLVAIERLRANQTGVMSRHWRWPHLWETVRDPKTWLWFALVFSISVPSGGISSFGPLLVKSFGFDAFHAILFNAPFGLVQLASTVGGALLAQKYRKKGPVIALLAVAPIAGCMIMMSTPHTPDRRSTLLFGYYLISVYPGIIPLMYSWSAANTAGDTKRKCTSSVIFVGQSLGNIIGPLLYKPSEAPEYFRGLQSNLTLYFLIVVLVAVTSAYLSHLNRDHGRRRVHMGKSAAVVDYSLLSNDEADRLRVEGVAVPGDDDYERGGEAEADDDDVDGEGRGPGSRAFDDLTDLQNEDFVFVY